MSFFKIKEDDGKWISIPAFKGEKGDKGEAGKDAVVDQIYSKTSTNAQSGVALAPIIGDIETALDSIIAIQNSLIGGDVV